MQLSLLHTIALLHSQSISGAQTDIKKATYPVHIKSLAINPPSLLPRQESNDRGYLIRRRNALLRVQALEEVDELLTLPTPEEVGINWTGRDTVNGDALGAEVFGEDSGHLLNSAFGRSVEEVVGRNAGEFSGGRREEEYATA